MVKSIFERIKEIYHCEKDVELAKILKADKANIANWKFRDKIPYSHLANLANETGLSLDWLIYGKGPKFRELVNFSGEKLSMKIDDENVEYIPYYEDILLSAGDGAINGDYHPKDMIVVPKNTFNCKEIEAVKIIGDSMTPTIMEDAIVFISRLQTQIKNGLIYAIRIDSETYLKRLFQTPDGVIVKSDNTLYPQFTVKKESLNIIGQVKGVMQKL